MVSKNNTPRRSPSEMAMRSLVEARVPVMLVSSPGMGKTASVRAMAQEMGYDLITLVPSRMDPQDLSGFPTKGSYEYEDEDGNRVTSAVTEFAPQHWQKVIMEKKKVVLFLDEFSNAHPSVRASLLSFIQDRQFPNGDIFPEETVLIGAMNPSDSAADGYELDPATTNRIAFISWNPDLQSWMDGMKENWGKECSEKEMEWRERIVRFISEKPGLLHRENNNENGGKETVEVYNFDSNNSSDRAVLSYAWASRRSWDNLARALSNETSQSEYVEDIIMRGMVGAEAGTHFRSWLEENSKLKVKDIINAPDKFKGWQGITANDATTILSSAIDGANRNNINNVIRIFEILVEVDKASFAAGHLQDFTTCHHGFSGELPDDERSALIKRMFEVISLYNNITKND